MILYGTSPIAWTNDDDPRLGADISLDQCLDEAAAIGFDGIEKGHRMPADADALKALLAPRGLRLVSAWYSLNLLARPVAAEKAAIAPHLDFLAAMGCELCIVCETANAIHADASKPLSASPRLPAADWPAFGAAVEEIARFAAARGLTLAYHHHVGTIVETADEIAAFMAATGPVTRLLLDTGHAFLSGADPGRLARAWMPRIAHLHFKNVRPAVMAELRAHDLSFLEAVRRGIFTVPGDPEGGVDFAPVLEAAAAHGYRGWLVVEAEQDPAAAPPAAYQTMGLAALRRMARRAGLDRGGAR